MGLILVVSPFIIDRTLYGLVGQVKSIRKIKEGLLVETVSVAQSLRLQKIEKLGEFSVEVLPHRTLNNSKGVITCMDLLNCTSEEILEGLKPEGVVEVKRITKRNHDTDTVTDTASLILTFNTPKLPTSIKAAFYSLKVRPYIPSPLRCFRCQRFGHTSARCDRQQVCVCGADLHEGSPCKTPITCVNCGEEHSAKSRNCRIYKEEQAIQRVKVENNISFAEARRKVKENTSNLPYSYAQIARTTPTKDIREIVKEMIPQISEICTAFLNDRLGTRISTQDQIQSWRSQTDASSTSGILRSESFTSEKRKRCTDHASNEESSEAEINPAKPNHKGKRKPGRPSKKPNS